MREPKYRKHSTRNKAIVEINGVRHTLPGKYDSHESRAAHLRLVTAWHVQRMGAVAIATKKPVQLTIAGLGVRWLASQSNGQPIPRRGNAANNRDALNLLLPHYGQTPVEQFGPKSLKNLQKILAKQGKVVGGKKRIQTDEPLSRKYINSQISRLKQMFQWGVSEELVSVEIVQALATVRELRKSEARSNPRRKPVPMHHVAAILRHLSPQVRAMVRLQVYTGLRSGSIVRARPEQFNRTGDLWLFRPRHKQEFRDQELIIPIGPRCQRVLKPWLDECPAGGFVFSPKRAGTNRRYREKYDVEGYCTAVVRAIDRANRTRKDKIPRWSPHRLRHSLGQAVREKFGIEAAQASLGHDSLSATQLYTARRLELAKAVARDMG